MLDQFEIAGGSVTGRDHLLAGRNNQDAYHWIDHDDLLVAVVADGCGSGKFSEVGARLGVRLVTEALRASVKNADPQTCLDQASFSVLMSLNQVARTMGRPLSQIIEDYFLFTIVGIVVAPWGVWIFSLGDGVIVVNGEEIPLGPFQNNAPPYLGYGIRLLDRDHEGSPLPRFTLNRQIPTGELQSALIGTDGAQNLERVGPLSQFWTDDRYFRNPDMVRRRLTLVNRDATRIDWEQRVVEREAGLLPDDTTLVVVRRKKT